MSRVRRLVADEIDGIIEDYQAGMCCILLARKYGVADNTVLDHLRAAGIEIRSRGQLTAEQVAQLHRWHAEGVSNAEIGRRLGITRQGVSLRLRRAARKPAGAGWSLVALDADGKS